MALVNCPECGRENVSDTAENCPSCGYGIREHFEQKRRAEEIRASLALREEKIKAEAEKLQGELNEKLEEIDKLPPPHRANSMFEYAFDLNENSDGIGLIYATIIGLVLSFVIAFSSVSGGSDIPFLIFSAIFLLILFIGVPILIVCIKVGYNSHVQVYESLSKDWEGEKNRRKQAIIEQYDTYATNMAIYGKRETPTIFFDVNQLKCPICGATDIERISTTKRSISVAAYGLASEKIGKQYKCRKCKHLW